MVLAFIFGLIFGSFLNVVIYRLKNGRDIVSGRSFCPDCVTQLKWHDLVPVLSFVWLRGRCRYCRKKISWQYPIVEILSGLIWVGVFYKVFGFHFSTFSGQVSVFNFQFLNLLNFFNLLNPLNLLNFFYHILILSVFLTIAVYDFRWYIIPNKIVYPAVAIVLIYNLFSLFKSGNFEMFIWSFTVALAAFLFFFSIFYFSSGRAMGLGDAKLAFLIGLFLSPVLTAIAFTLAFLIGALFGIILIGLGQIFPHYRKWEMKSQIAFGPFLALGAAVAFFIFKF